MKAITLRSTSTTNTHVNEADTEDNVLVEMEDKVFSEVEIAGFGLSSSFSHCVGIFFKQQKISLCAQLSEREKESVTN